MSTAKRQIALIGVVALCLGSAEANEWEGVCWTPHDDFIEERSEYLDFTYSWVNVNAVRATYFVGKPTYLMLTRLEGAAFDAVTGLGGGPLGVVASVAYGQGVDAALALLADIAETPQDMATEIGGRTMEKGIRAMNENYRLYRRGLSRLDNATKLEFRQNQIYVDLMGSAKKLYLAAKEDRAASSIDPAVLDALSGLETILASTPLVGGVATVMEITEILRQSGINLEGYTPYGDYLRSLASVRSANGIVPCGTNGPADFGEIRADATGGDIVEPPLESTLVDVDVRSVEAYVGGNVTVSGAFAASEAMLTRAGWVIVLPDGSELSCMDGTISRTYGCRGRGWSRHGFVENDIFLRGFRDAGLYRIYFDASRSPHQVSLGAGHASALVERWGRAGSFDGQRTEVVEFPGVRIAAGDVVLLAEIVVR